MGQAVENVLRWFAEDAGWLRLDSVRDQLREERADTDEQGAATEIYVQQRVAAPHHVHPSHPQWLCRGREQELAASALCAPRKRDPGADFLCAPAVVGVTCSGLSRSGATGSLSAHLGGVAADAGVDRTAVGS